MRSRAFVERAPVRDNGGDNAEKENSRDQMVSAGRWVPPAEFPPVPAPWSVAPERCGNGVATPIRSEEDVSILARTYSLAA